MAQIDENEDKFKNRRKMVWIMLYAFIATLIVILYKVMMGLPSDFNYYSATLTLMLTFVTTIILSYFGLATYEQAGMEKNKKDVAIEEIKASGDKPQA